MKLNTHSASKSKKHKSTYGFGHFGYLSLSKLVVLSKSWWWWGEDGKGGWLSKIEILRS